MSKWWIAKSSWGGEGGRGWKGGGGVDLFALHASWWGADYLIAARLTDVCVCACVCGRVGVYVGVCGCVCPMKAINHPMRLSSVFPGVPSSSELVLPVRRWKNYTSCKIAAEKKIRGTLLEEKLSRFQPVQCTCVCKLQESFCRFQFRIFQHYAIILRWYTYNKKYEELFYSKTLTIFSYRFLQFTSQGCTK